MDEKETAVDRIVDLLNLVSQASGTDVNERVLQLEQAQELILANDLLDNFLDEVLCLQNDLCPSIKRLVIGFMETCLRKDTDYFPKLMPNLIFLINDSNSNVIKKVIQTVTQLYRQILFWLSRADPDDEQTQSMQKLWTHIKQIILDLFESTENDGIRTQCIKFMEALIILQTPINKLNRQPEEQDAINFEQLSASGLLQADLVEAEARRFFDQLIIFHGSQHISSVNLMATMQSLVQISRRRPSQYMDEVIKALTEVNANLPPTLGKSQVSSVRKQLKVQLMILMKHPDCLMNSRYQTQLVELLTNLGVSQSEIGKCFQDARKRGLKVEQIEPKRIKLDNDEVNGKVGSNVSSETHQLHQQVSNEQQLQKPPTVKMDQLPIKISRQDANQAVDITAGFLTSKFESIDMVTDLVLVSLLSTPETMPEHFPTSYNPSNEPGNAEHVALISKSLSLQFTSAGIGKGIDEIISRVKASLKKSYNVDVDANHGRIAQTVTKAIVQEIRKQESLSQGNSSSKLIASQSSSNLPKQATSTVNRAKQLNFAEITKVPTEEFKYHTVFSCINRVLDDEGKQFFNKSQIDTRSSILSSLSIDFAEKYPQVFEKICDYAFDDLRARNQLLSAMIVKANDLVIKSGPRYLPLYNEVLVSILNKFMEMEINDRDHYLPQFFKELPQITDHALNILNNYISISDQTSTISSGFGILKHLIEKFGEMRYPLLNMVLNFCLSEESEMKKQASQTIKLFYETSDENLKRPIEEFARNLLQKLLLPQPPADLSTTGEWDEDTIRHCLLPYLNLLPSNHKLIHELANVYVGTIANVKRIILRSLETPVKGMGMNSPELLLLVESCPKGGETMVTRIIHVLTEKHPPSAELVARVRDLYHKRVPDVRFLIPVLNGLSKREVIEALPKLIQLNPVVVKEVFNRLFSSESSVSGTSSSTSINSSPLTPSELLIALHNIDSSSCDMKTIIKATSLCFAEKNVYTAEVLAVVMQLLMEQNPIPTLLMRTVIQSLSLYPRLSGFIMNILQRLILKQVWKEKKLWDGFIMCCQRMKPQSFQVLLQLPPPQLRTVFLSSPDLKPALQDYVRSFTDTQKQMIQQSKMDVIFSDDIEEPTAHIGDDNEVEDDGAQAAAEATNHNETSKNKPVEVKAEIKTEKELPSSEQEKKKPALQTEVRLHERQDEQAGDSNSEHNHPNSLSQPSA